MITSIACGLGTFVVIAAAAFLRGPVDRDDREDGDDQ